MTPKKAIKWRRTPPSGLIAISYAEAPGWHNSGQATVKDAMAWARAMKGELLQPKALTFADLAAGFFDSGGAYERWLSRAKIRRSAPYLPQMRGRLARYLLPAFGHRPVAEIAFREFSEWWVDLKGMGGKDIKNSTKNKILDCAKILFREWTRDGLIPASPIDGLTHLPETDETPRDVFDEKEVGKLFPLDRDALERIWADQGKQSRQFGQLWLSYFIAARDTGARPSELLALCWRDYDAEFRGFPVTKAVENTTGEIKPQTKTGSVKAALLSPRGVQELMLWAASSAHVQPGDLVWSFDGRLPVRTESALKHFRGVCKRAGVERGNRTPYCLRHTFATRALESGVLTLADIQLLMGHSPNAKTVLDSYFHPTAKGIMRMAAEAGEKLSRIPGRS